MTPSLVFSLSSNLALLAWIYLLFGARWTPKPFAVVRIAVPLVLSVGYASAIGFAIPSWEGGFSSIESVRLLFQNDWALTAGWVHYLAFDFFVGCWILARSLEDKISHWLVIPCLILAFMLGPVGFLLYWILSTTLKRKDDNQADLESEGIAS